METFLSYTKYVQTLINKKTCFARPKNAVSETALLIIQTCKFFLLLLFPYQQIWWWFGPSHSPKHVQNISSQNRMGFYIFTTSCVHALQHHLQCQLKHILDRFTHTSRDCWNNKITQTWFIHWCEVQKGRLMQSFAALYTLSYFQDNGSFTDIENAGTPFKLQWKGRF